jgi:hypothetical protein
MSSKKCQLKLGQKNTWPSHYGQVQNDLSKMVGSFFLRLSKMGTFLPKFLVKTNRNCSSDSSLICMFKILRLFVKALKI